MSHDRPTLVLQPGETLLIEGRPSPAAQLQKSLEIGIALLAGVLSLPLAPFAPVFASRFLGWHRWWLTDRRLVVRNGFIGRTMRAIPLDRIVDVSTKMSWWDRIFGLQHILIRDMTGEGATSGAITTLIAVEEAEAVAERVLSATPRSAVNDADLEDVVELLQQLVDKAA